SVAWCHEPTRALQQNFLMGLQRSLFRMNRIDRHRLLRGAHNSWQSDREGRSATRRALDRDVTAHHLTEAAANGEAKPRATVFARRSRGSLGKLLKQLAHLLGRHPDASIGNGKRDPVAAVLLSFVSGDGDGTFLGKLVGVTRQVEQRLPEAG